MGIPLLAAPSSGDSLAATSCTAGPRELAFRLEGMTSQRGACRFTLRFDDAGFLRAFRQDLYAPPLADRVDGYHGDPSHALDSASLAELRDMRRAGEAWRWVLDKNLLMPPEADDQRAAKGGIPGVLASGATRSAAAPGAGSAASSSN
jgi:hypothetical protein